MPDNKILLSLSELVPGTDEDSVIEIVVSRRTVHATTPPVTPIDPPVIEPPHVDPPVVDPPVVDPPIDPPIDPPVVDPPVDPGTPPDVPPVDVPPVDVPPPIVPPPVIPPPTGAGVLFATDWRTALGISDAAVLDTSSATSWGDQANWGSGQVQVVPAQGLAFPPGMANVLRSNYGPGKTAANEITSYNSVIPGAPAVGETRYYRLYWRLDWDVQAVGSLGGGAHHPVSPQSGSHAGHSTWHFTAEAGGGMNMTYWGSHNGIGQMKVPSQPFRLFNTYRIEWALTRTNAGYGLDIRVYNSADVLMASGDQWQDATGKGITQIVHQRDALDFSTMRLGNNGTNISIASPQYSYYGGFMIRNDTWCGPY